MSKQPGSSSPAQLTFPQIAQAMTERGDKMRKSTACKICQMAEVKVRYGLLSLALTDPTLAEMIGVRLVETFRSSSLATRAKLCGLSAQAAVSTPPNSPERTGTPASSSPGCSRPGYSGF